MSRIRIFAPDRTFLTCLRGTTEREWVLNDEGLCTIEMAQTDPKARAEYLEFGRYILIEEEGLPMWGGVIDTPRQWSTHSFTVTAYSAEHLLKWRYTPNDQSMKDLAGNLFQSLIHNANAPEDLGLRIGTIQDKGLVLEEPGGYNMLELVQKIAKEAGCEFGFIPAIGADHRIYFMANWYHKRGTVMKTELVEGHNVEASDNILSEQGDIYNLVVGLNDVSSPHDRITVTLGDLPSIHQYRLRESSNIFTGTKGPGLQGLTQTMLDVDKEPTRSYALNVLKVGSAWNELGVGNTGKVRMKRVGFRRETSLGRVDPIRIQAMKRNDGVDKMAITPWLENAV
jgi:hypothetical protein